MRILPFLLATLLVAKVTHAAPSSDEAPLEIEVKEAPKEPGEAKLPAREVAKMPGAFGDPLRAIESLPGVVPLYGGVPYFYVRGAPPSANHYTIDGVAIPLLFHIGAGPSVIAPGLIDEVSFHPSVAPISYGRFAGGFIGATTRAPATETHMQSSLRPYDAAALAETQVGDTDVLVAGRYGNPNYVLGLVGSNVRLQYGDYQIRVGHRIGADDRVSVFAFGASDAMSGDDGNILSTHFHRVDMRWEHRFSQRAKFLAAVTLAEDYTDESDHRASNLQSIASMHGVGVRFALEQALSPSVLLRAGADGWLRNIHDTTTDGASTLTGAHRSTPLGVYADLVVTPFDGLTLIPGVRVDRYATTEERVTVDNRYFRDDSQVYPAMKQVAVDPRLRSRLRITKNVSWISSMGIAHQGPEYAMPLPGVQLSSESTRLQEAFQVAEGFEFALPEKTTLSVTGFRSVVRHVRDLIVACTDGADPNVSPNRPPPRLLPEFESDCAQGDQGDVYTHGLELLFRRDLSKRVGGMLAYTLSRSVRDDGTLARYDRPHVLSAILSVMLGNGFRAGGRFAYESGRPFRRTVDGYVEEMRLPVFYRVDLRLEKQWRVGGSGRVAVVAEILNALFRKEPASYDCNATCTVTSIGPITLPSLGVEGGF